MRKLTLNLYEQELPPENINNLWVDRDENIDDIKAIHRYNKKEREWEPYLVSVDYLKGDSPGSSTGNGNIVISSATSRVGYYRFSDRSSMKVIESDELFVLDGTKQFSSIAIFFNLFTDLYQAGIDVSSYIEQLGYNGLYELFEKRQDSNPDYIFHTSIIDVLSFTNYDEWDSPVSTGILPYLVAFSNIVEFGDTRPFDEIVAEVSLDIESNINWSSQFGTDYYFVIPRMNKNGIINVFRLYCDFFQEDR